MNAILIPAIVSFMLAQTAGTPASLTSELAWDAPTTNADGTPLTDLAGYVLAISPETADLRAGDPPLQTVKIESSSQLQSDLVELGNGLPGGTYKFWVSAYDTAQNQGQWSLPLTQQFDPVKPGTPTNVRISVTVINDPSTLIDVDLLLDGEQGNDGDALTTSMLTGMQRSSASFPSGTWSIGGTNSWKIKNVGEVPSQVSFAVDGTPYSDAAGTRGLVLESLGSQNRYIQYDFTSNYDGDLTFGCWVWIPPQGTNFPTIDLVHLETTGGDWAVAQYVDYDIAADPNIHMHSNSGTGNDISFGYNTWYWLTFEALQNQTCRLRMYDIDGNLIGTSSLSQPGTDPWNWMRIGRADSHGNYSSITGELRIDDVVVDTTDASFSLGPPI